MFRRLLTTLVTTVVTGAVLLPTVTAAPAAAGSLGDWQRGQWWVDSTQLKSWHAQGITGTGVTIALLDGPVATGIPELQGQDVRPTASLCDGDLWRSWGPTTPDGPLDETSFHTTSMAALLVGSGKGNGPNGVGVLGVAPGATLKTYAMFNTVDPAAHQNLDCWSPGVAGFIDRMVADGAQVIEIPVSIDVTGDEIQAAFDRAFAKGVVVVAASGNGGPSAKVMSPGGNSGVLVVGGMQPDGKVLATNPTSTLDSWEQARTFRAVYNIHLVAPGADLVGGGLATGNRWDSAVLQSGSSGASAIVAGQLALMRQKWPAATGNQLITSLLRAAQHPDGAAVWDPRRGFGTTSFETTLTTDPTAYADVMPIYASMGNVLIDQPTTSAAPRAPDVAAPPPAMPVPTLEATTSDSAWLVWLVCGVVAVALLAAGGLLLTQRSPRRGLPAAPVEPVGVAAVPSSSSPHMRRTPG